MMSIDTSNATPFLMPSLGADMTEGRITEWLVAPGDTIERGQIVVIVETDKSDIEVEVFESATVIDLIAEVGDVVPVGEPIARFTSGTDAPPTADAEPEPATGATLESPPHVTSPVIRHLAEELHVDPESVQGTGPGGRVHRDDIEATAAATTSEPTSPIAAAPRSDRQRMTPRARRLIAERGLDAAAFAGRAVVTGDDVLAAPPATPEPAKRPSRAETMRRHIADLMSRSWAEIPHFHLAKRLDLGDVIARLSAENEERSIEERVVPSALLLCATARAAAAVPACNGWWRDAFVEADSVDLGIVLSLRTGGIIVPTIERADELTPVEMMRRLDELVQRARQGRLRATDLNEASITVTNLGDRGADSVGGVIHPPQVAIVGFGAIHDEVVAVDGQPTVRPTVHASLAADHRALDGLSGSRFLSRLYAQLTGPVLEEI